MLSKLKLKYIQSLGQKKQRDQEGLFIAEGPKIIAELMAGDKARIQQLYAVNEWIEKQEAAIEGMDVTDVSPGELGKISQQSTPNQVLALVKKWENPAIHTKNTLTLALDSIQDPGNLGTIIRIADWFGVKQVVCSRDTADMYNPKVVQASMGSMARVGVLYTDLPAWLAGQEPVCIYGAFLEGKDVTTMSKLPEGIILIGNESKGIRDEATEHVDTAITIPRKGAAESLNAAVATGIILSHLT